MEGTMICSVCGREMNHHADKVVHRDGAFAAEQLAGGSLEQFHSCPNCGYCASRPAVGLTAP